MIGARLKCMRDNRQVKEHSHCSQSMKSNALFIVEVVSDRDVFVYLFAESDGQFSILYPKNHIGILKSDTPLILPQQTAWQLDQQSQQDELWMIASVLPLPMLQSICNEDQTRQKQINDIVQRSRITGDQDQVSVKSKYGVAFLRWILEAPLKGVALHIVSD